MSVLVFVCSTSASWNYLRGSRCFAVAELRKQAEPCSCRPSRVYCDIVYFSLFGSRWVSCTTTTPLEIPVHGSYQLSRLHKIYGCFMMSP